MIPGTHVSYQYLSTPSFLFTKHTPTIAKSQRILEVSSTDFPHIGATSSALIGLRIVSANATSAISSVTTGSKILYSGSLTFIAFLEFIFFLLTLLANSNTLTFTIFFIFSLLI